MEGSEKDECLPETKTESKEVEPEKENEFLIGIQEDHTEECPGEMIAFLRTTLSVKQANKVSGQETGLKPIEEKKNMPSSLPLTVGHPTSCGRPLGKKRVEDRSLPPILGAGQQRSKGGKRPTGDGRSRPIFTKNSFLSFESYANRRTQIEGLQVESRIETTNLGFDIATREMSSGAVRDRNLYHELKLIARVFGIEKGRNPMASNSGINWDIELEIVNTLLVPSGRENKAINEADLPPRPTIIDDRSGSDKQSQDRP
ncbi:hypothetical protein M9H77_11713 [Catharanthus roseus]|uniref:Uncharacterized protein n=1 Tax=Catharanthus roseus TaxID=4058 RepID=A0ACC0BFF1_CATRO|nr:hypothetical protein M9H77_11713 [Catharanthus roseus]